MKSHEAAIAGVGLVPEDRRIIPGLTVHENLELAQIAEPIGWDIELLYERFPRLAERRKQEAVTMSGGEQQMLAVARALARNVKLLLLDEPYEGLAPVIVQEIERIVREIKDAGITTIIVEQKRRRGAQASGPRGHPRQWRGRLRRHGRERAERRRAARAVPGDLTPGRAPRRGALRAIVARYCSCDRFRSKEGAVGGALPYIPVSCTKRRPFRRISTG